MGVCKLLELATAERVLRVSGLNLMLADIPSVIALLLEASKDQNISETR